MLLAIVTILYVANTMSTGVFFYYSLTICLSFTSFLPISHFIGLNKVKANREATKTNIS